MERNNWPCRGQYYKQTLTGLRNKCALFEGAVRLLRTVQQQVKGKLCLKLRSGMECRVIRQKTSTIKEDILLAAVGAKVNQDELQTLLHVTKHTNYNDVQRSIHSHFFDRATARKYEIMSVPFRGAIYAYLTCTSRTRVPYRHANWDEMGCAWRPIRRTRWNYTTYPLH